jgi:hypothetical protein
MFDEVGIEKRIIRQGMAGWKMFQSEQAMN